MNKKLLLSSLGILTVGAGGFLLFNGEGETTEATSNSPIESEAVEVVTVGQEPSENKSSQPASEAVGGLSISPIEGMSEDKFLDIQDQFKDIKDVEDYNREIVQMTIPKIESYQIKLLLGGDAPLFPVTPSYPSPIGDFDATPEFALFNDDNIEYFKYFSEKLDLSDEEVDYYQGFLTDWQNEDYSDLIEIHQELLKKIAKPTEVTEDYLNADDLRLATEEEEATFIEMHQIGMEVEEYVPEETEFGSVY